MADADFRHDTPDELQAALDADDALAARWDDLTDLARNEYICWMTSAKKEETRDKRFARLKEEVLDGKRRPCCWPGCPHRRESAQKWFD
ncbi:YdeI/OmpD-associated family protein [Sphingomicrobium nitratireducens]|uniref:YdeI/OmpD-associated family protein n=1 Tax=Sphingomicrobium nitratireducens TaxID=2964666 RepID=UPI00223EE0CC|nr:YdeI/OmpD-associated family protein [Sphingomicrobium nitratireducens]